ncbi:MAG: isoprenylcysteine carboxylmethyltransferase family protein [Anaerolineae bacterium]|nr:isoprenylcysteine carboxylmethyltransferase family protein [Anaerolineae bacterium]
MSETIFRLLLAVATLAMLIIRVYYQSKVLHDKGRRIEVREGGFSLIAGSIAALTAVLFGAEYIFCRGFFAFAYLLQYPEWLRWLGVVGLGLGIGLLWWSHHHLGRSFHSLVVEKENQELVKTGPYRWIRHPIYTAYLMNYVGGGLLSSNVVLTVVPVLMFAILVGLRMGKEEEMLKGEFGAEYSEYMKETGRLLPRIRR